MESARTVWVAAMLSVCTEVRVDEGEEGCEDSRAETILK